MVPSSEFSPTLTICAGSEVISKVFRIGGWRREEEEQEVWQKLVRENTDVFRKSSECQIKWGFMLPCIVKLISETRRHILLGGHLNLILAVWYSIYILNEQATDAGFVRMSGIFELPFLYSPVKTMVHDNKDGTYYVSYTPKEPGTYTVLVCVKEQHVQLSDALPTVPGPFTPPPPPLGFVILECGGISHRNSC